MVTVYKLEAAMNIEIRIINYAALRKSHRSWVLANHLSFLRRRAAVARWP